MTPSELWERYKTLLFDDPTLGVRLDLSRMNLDVRALEEGEEALQAAYSEMDALEAGGIANPDENRMVGSLLAAGARPRSERRDHAGHPGDAGSRSGTSRRECTTAASRPRAPSGSGDSS